MSAEVDLPRGDSPTLALVHPTEEEQLIQSKLQWCRMARRALSICVSSPRDHTLTASLDKRRGHHVLDPRRYSAGEQSSRSTIRDQAPTRELRDLSQEGARLARWEAAGDGVPWCRECVLWTALAWKRICAKNDERVGKSITISSNR